MLAHVSRVLRSIALGNMKPGRGIACEEHLLGSAVPLFDHLAGGMRI
jgi:hypothetical protein